MSTEKQRSREKLAMFETGKSSIIASRMDRRFSYCTYVPKNYDVDGTKVYPVVVIVHGSERGVESYRDAFAEFAEENDVVIVSPLFPINALFDGDNHSYKLLNIDGVRFDEILLDMIDEVAENYRLQSDKIMMYGFSGGGQFSHRFLYLHPERLRAISIGAPGTVTLLDNEEDYWVGIRNFEDVFGKKLDLDTVRDVPIQLLAGDQDLSVRWCKILPEDREFWMNNANKSGITRFDRLLALAKSYSDQGIEPEVKVYKGVGHDDVSMLDDVKAFFQKHLNSIDDRD